MATKKKTDKGAAEAAPHKALHPAVLENAQPGNREGMAIAFAQAAGWLRAGESPPPELSAWLAMRLQSLANHLAEPGDKKLAGVNRALGLVEAGRPGKKPASAHTKAGDRFLAWDCFRVRVSNPALNWQEVFERVAEEAARGGAHFSIAKVEGAWKTRATHAPDIPEIAP